MARSQRHRIEIQGVHADERIGTIPTRGTYNGSHLRQGMVGGGLQRMRAGASMTADGAAGAGTIIGGFSGVVGAPVCALGHVNGSIAPVYKRPLAGNAP
jgi:hypothetical protein